jgi:membrane-bound serine protease (ClpP class)
MSVARLFVIAALAGMIGFGSARHALAQTPTPANSAAVIRISGEVDDYRRDMLFSRFHKAEASGAKIVILEIDTYGGLVTSGLDISRFLRGQSKVHTVAFIDNKAISAGSLIALACDEIVMSPGSVIGDCAPIVFDRSGSLVSLAATERAKIASPILRDFEDSATKNGYAPVLAEAMVKVETSVYLVRDRQGHERAVDEAEYKQLTATDEWQPAPHINNPVDGPETLLTVGPDLAARLGLSKGTAATAQNLASQRGYKIISDLRPGAGDAMVEALNSYGARFILLVVFVLSLYIVLHAPGHGAAEALSVLSFGLLVGIPLLTGYAQWWELAMIFVGLGLCAFEIFVFPGHGVSLIVGMGLLLIGFVFTFVGKDAGGGWLPGSASTWHHLQNGLMTVAAAMVASIVVMFQLRKILPRMPMFSRLILTETSAGQVPTPAGTPHKAGDDVWPFIGTVGVAVSDLHPGGVVRFPYGADMRNASVVCTAGFVESGSKVVVEEARGNRIVVRSVPTARSDSVSGTAV